jgi:hypothetical protein
LKTNGKFGCLFILASGVLFTIERYFTIIKWTVITTPMLTRGNGSYNSTPDMPDIKTNYFVPIFLLLGFFLLILEISDTYKRKVFGMTILAWASIFIIGILADYYIPGLGSSGVIIASIIFIITMLYHIFRSKNTANAKSDITK